MKDLTNSPSASDLSDWVQDARQRTLDLVSDLSDEQLMGAKLDIVNPMLWEIGHAAWFQEKWVLRHVLGEPAIREDADTLWDSMAIAHDTRWDLPLPTRRETLDYLVNVRDAVLDALAKHEPTPDLLYHARYAVHHEDMHNEAFTYTRQTHEYTPPSIHHVAEPVPDGGGSCEGDVAVPGGEFPLGAEPQGQFVFDNEKWAHAVRLEPFAIARAPVTQAEFAAFCDDGGYDRREWWSEDGWQWKESQAAEHPLYWRSDGAGGAVLVRLPCIGKRLVVHVLVVHRVTRVVQQVGGRFMFRKCVEYCIANVCQVVERFLSGRQRQIPPRVVRDRHRIP